MAPLEALDLKAVGTVRHILNHLLAFPVCPPALHDLQVGIDAEVIEGGCPSTCSVEMSVDQQVCDICSCGYHRVRGFVDKIGQVFENRVNPGIVVFMILSAHLQVIVNEIVAQKTHVVGIPHSQCFLGFLHQGQQFDVSFLIGESLIVVFLKSGEECLACGCIARGNQFVGLLDIVAEGLKVCVVDGICINQSLGLGNQFVEAVGD